MKKDTSWGKVSNWYDKVVENDDSYQKQVILPNLIRVLDLKHTDRVLDIACGQGFFSHETAKTAKEVTGFDIGKPLVDLANKTRAKNEQFVVASADKAFPFQDISFDKIFCVLALQNIKDLNNVFKEASRVVKQGGRLIFVLNHPVFRVPQASDWGYDEEKRAQYRKVYSYLSEQTVSIDMHPGKQNSPKTISFHRPLQVYFKNLAKNGFAVLRFEEWISHKESQKGPRKLAEDKARKEIPLFLMIEAVKL